MKAIPTYNILIYQAHYLPNKSYRLCLEGYVLSSKMYTSMANKENKMLEELRRHGDIFEDPCPKSEGFIGKLIDLFSKKKS